tara:strand:- start:7942 stop:8166 length:225 start_codon:yes stop_codon:yes gene_type:complete
MDKKIINVDLLGFKCPIPVLKANKKIKEYSSGDIINFIVDDESAPNDFKILCDTKGYKIIKIDKEKNITITIKI